MKIRGKVVAQEEYPVEPAIKVLDKNVLQIHINIGNPVSYDHFYNVRTGALSEVYYNPIFIDKHKIGYFKDEKTIAISDLFDKKKYYKEVNINLSPTADPSTAIHKAEIINNDLYISYSKGTDYEDAEKIVNLD